MAQKDKFNIAQTYTHNFTFGSHCNGSIGTWRQTLVVLKTSYVILLYLDIEKIIYDSTGNDAVSEWYV